MSAPIYTIENALAEVAEFERTALDALEKLKIHIEQSSQAQTPATGWAPVREILATLDVQQWINNGGMNRESFTHFLDDYLRYSVQFRHPGYIAHQVSVPDYPAALGAMINGLTNNPMALYEMGAGAAAIEFAVVNWMLEKIGWPIQRLGDEASPDMAGGVFTHGGSLANLTALLAARARIAPDAWVDGTPRDLAVLVPGSAHYSNARAVSILGLGSRSLYPIDVTEFGQIKPSALSAALENVHRDGKRCMALIAGACSTATGLHDPLRPIGEFCQQHNIWFHVDACHGASALMAPKLRHLLDGVELADSLVWDTHKMMQVPVLSAAVLLKNVQDFDHAFHQEASYLAYGKSPDNYDTIQRTIECTRSAMAFKVFLNLAWRGEKALGDYVQHCYDMAQRFYKLIRSRDGFSCPYRPESNIVCFRFGTDNQEQERIRDELMRTGQFHISSTLIGDARYLRLTVMNKLTSEATIKALLNAIEVA